MTARKYFASDISGDLQAVFPGLLLSILFHIVFAAVILFAPGFKGGKRAAPAAMTVNLVALPETGFSGPTVSDTAGVEKSPKPEAPKKAIKTAAVAPRKKPAPKEGTPVPKAPEVKRSLKKKTFKTGKVVKQAVKEIEKQVAEKRPDAVNRAIERIREKEGAAHRPENAAEQAPNEIRAKDDGPPGGGSNSAGGKDFDQIDLYKLEVKYRIQKNWAYSEQLAGRQSGLESLLVIRVMPDGEIKDVWFEKKSGNSHLDDSAYRAVLKSNPLPPLPRGFSRPFFTVGMIFTPSGLQ